MSSSIVKRLIKGSKSPYATSYLDSEFYEVENYYDSGNYMLNGIISGDIYKGMPEGRIIELAGDSSTGKSLIMMAVGLSFIKKDKNNIYVLFDSEFGTKADEIKKQLTDDQINNQFVVVPIRTYEELIFCSANVLKEIKASIDDGDKFKYMFGLDSLSSLIPQSQLDKIQGGKDTKVMNEQQLIKIFFNQIRHPLIETKTCLFFCNHVYLDIMNAGMYTPKVDKQVSRGGQGVQYSSDIRLRLFKKRLKEDKTKKEIGIKIEVMPVKSRYIGTHSKVEIDVLFAGGIDSYSGIWHFLEVHELFKKKSMGSKGTEFSIDEIGWKVTTGEIKKMKSKSELFTKELLDYVNVKFKELFGLSGVSDDLSETLNLEDGND